MPTRAEHQACLNALLSEAEIARSKSRDELAQSMPCKEEEDEVKVSLDKKIQTVNLTDGVFG